MVDFLLVSLAKAAEPHKKAHRPCGKPSHLSARPMPAARRGRRDRPPPPEAQSYTPRAWLGVRLVRVLIGARSIATGAKRLSG